VTEEKSAAAEGKRLGEIPLSVLDLSPITAGGSPAESYRNTLDLARHAEEWGFHRYWLAEHHGMPGVASSATAVVIGYVAGGTSKIRVGSGGIMLPNHAPLVIAEQFGTLESMYPGRIDLGLGRAPGSDPATARALRRDLRGDDFPGLLEELRGYLNPAESDSVPAVRAVPGEGLNIPIWLLGSSGYSARLAGELGLPFAFASHFSPDYTLPALELYRGCFRPSMVLDAPYAMIGVHVVAADTEEKARLLATSQMQQFLGLTRGRPGPLQPPVPNMDELWSPYEKASIEHQLRYSAVGSAETVQARLQSILDATQADELIITSQIYDHQDRLRSYEIVSRFIAGR